MSKAEDFLEECKRHVGEWVCSLHTTSSNQPAAIFREVKKQGYDFEEISTNRWGKSMYCEVCKDNTTHYKLKQLEPILTRKERLLIDKDTRRRILNIFDNKDAFTGGSISSVAEIDHKVPWTRLDQDIDARKLTDDQIKENFQLLTREHNLLKDRACQKCKNENIRPPFLGIPFWYSGNDTYSDSCEGCGWFDSARWREEVTKILIDKK
ncbi:hypothetical protein [Prevotella intermedia]|uniref:hypothetical protein n=1 Tax=Prevotella intermedia TaxID=28131 RepID=UPI00077DFE55|nr:hypothetical protein [Prevotella intermedia]